MLNAKFYIYIYNIQNPTIYHRQLDGLTDGQIFKATNEETYSRRWCNDAEKKKSDMIFVVGLSSGVYLEDMVLSKTLGFQTPADGITNTLSLKLLQEGGSSSWMNGRRMLADCLFKLGNTI